MYERSAIVLENYFTKILGFNKPNNLKTNYQEYTQMIEEIKEYQRIIQEEEKIILKFDEVASEIEEIQNKQTELHEQNFNLETARDQLFNDLSENPTSSLDQKLKKIEDVLEKNNNELKEIREKYVKALVIFTERQRERNKYAKIHRTTEAEYLAHAKQAVKNFDEVDPKIIEIAKKFVELSKDNMKQELIGIMLKNGKNERIAFNNEVIKNAVDVRTDVAEKEVGLYLDIYERMKKLLLELNTGNIKLAKSEKLSRDVGVKIAFLNAEKEYIVSFLDNERITAINGRVIHDELMKEACKNFLVDIKQINNLYELIVKESTNKATKKAYKELYNKTYLKSIQEKERDFEQEVTSIKINIGTVINSNYWRIEGIKNIYNTFQEEVTDKFGKDLSEYKVEDLDEDTFIPDQGEDEPAPEPEKKEEYNIEDYIVRDYSNKIKENNKLNDDVDQDYDHDDYYDDDEYDDDEYDKDGYEDDEYDDDEEYEDDDNDEYDNNDDEYDDEDEEDDIIGGKHPIIQTVKKKSNLKEKNNNDEKKGKGLFGKWFKNK